MHLVLIKVTPPVLEQVIASKGAMLAALSADEVPGFRRFADVEDRIPYRDIRTEAEDPDSAIRAIIDGGTVFSPGLRWTHTHPAWHGIARVQALARELPALAVRKRLLDQLVHPDVPSADGPEAIARIADFFARAAGERKAVIAGVA
jgi:hypothetical protein